jgi:hypothetical protein
LLPHIESAQPETREFLQKVIDILLDYVNACNNRDEKILEFHHPEDMKKLLDLDINEDPVQLQQLIIDCATTMKYQVKTGECHNRVIKTHQNSIFQKQNILFHPTKLFVENISSIIVRVPNFLFFFFLSMNKKYLHHKRVLLSTQNHSQ